MCNKPLRKKDIEILERIATGQRGNIWRSPLVEAMKRAGAAVQQDEHRRLIIVFGEHALHPARLDLAKAEEFETPFAHDLRAMASALLTQGKPSLRV